MGIGKTPSIGAANTDVGQLKKINNWSGQWGRQNHLREVVKLHSALQLQTKNKLCSPLKIFFGSFITKNTHTLKQFASSHMDGMVAKSFFEGIGF